MKKILFALIALVCSMSMNAQVMIVMRGNTVVATYTAEQADNVVFKNALASVKFENTDFTGYGSSTITASNDDVTIALALSSDSERPEWNTSGTIRNAMGDSKLTITVTPKAGVTVTGIEYKGEDNTATKTGAGPWEFTVKRDRASDGSTNLGRSFESITVNYAK